MARGASRAVPAGNARGHGPRPGREEASVRAPLHRPGVRRRLGKQPRGARRARRARERVRAQQAGGGEDDARIVAATLWPCWVLYHVQAVCSRAQERSRPPYTLSHTHTLVFSLCIDAPLVSLVILALLQRGSRTEIAYGGVGFAHNAIRRQTLGAMRSGLNAMYGRMG